MSHAETNSEKLPLPEKLTNEKANGDKKSRYSGRE
jgi:hypothetical protein